MKNVFFTTAVVLILTACNSNKSTEQNNPTPGIHKVVVEEVLQTSQYTYMHVKEGNDETWLAVTKMPAAEGETYYYRDGLPMNDFESKELNKKFEQILFVDNVSTSPAVMERSQKTLPDSAGGNMNSLPGISMDDQVDPVSSSSHTVVAEEVLQTSKYTYIRVKENNKEQWIAVSKMDARAGSTYHFEGGLLMNDFESKELKRTFKQVLFVDKISAGSPETTDNNPAAPHTNAIESKGSAIDLEKKDIKMNHVKDDITIAKLLGNKKIYSGKTIKIKGQVTKYNSGIMQKNWIHLQDGTELDGKFDLTVTTDQEVKVGDNIMAEGKITLDKDFGYGYYYEVLMEDAKISK